jgi:small subunit ribosomal protein S16
MPVKIRLQRKGRKKRPFYHIVAADARAPRDGRYIDHLGTYNPMTKPATIDLDIEKTFSWLQNGAQPTDTARAIMKYKGVYYKKHLQRGVSKGALTQEKADEMLSSWLKDKESKIQEQIEITKKEREAFLAIVDGVASAPKAKKEVETELLADAPKGEEVTNEAEEGATEASGEDTAE